MLAMILSVSPQRTQVSISTLNTRCSRRAQLIAMWRGVGGWVGCEDLASGLGAPNLRPAGVTVVRS